MELSLTPLIEILRTNTLLLLFTVVAVGYPLGKIKVFGCSLGIAAVLFSGIAFGSLHPEMKLPEIIYIFGLVLFVYSIGLSSGSAFFSTLRKEGLRNNLFAVIVLLGAFGITLAAAALIEIKPTFTSGLFAGSLTNTPALAAILETVKTYAPSGLTEAISTEPVIAYSIAYPMGVMGVMLAIVIGQRLFRIEYAVEARKIKGFSGSSEGIETRTILITNRELEQFTLGELFRNNPWNIVFGRLKRGSRSSILTGETRFLAGDLVTAIGTKAELDQVTADVGVVSEEHIERDKSELQMRRIFVSNPEIEGKRLKDLKITARFGATITRLRRGDMDMIVNGKTILEPGDRVRVIAPYNRMEEVSRFFGDSYRAVSELDVLTFSLGLTFGLAIGLIPIPLSGDITLRLGVAGGPLIAGLILGYFSRSGKLVWNIPYSVDMTLRQIGLVLFLAGVGTKAGYGFVSTFLQGGGLMLFAAGAFITFSAAMLALIIGYKIFRINFCVLTGMVAGLHTQPAVLGFALEQSKNDLPNLGYSIVYPTATIVKILLAQIILTPYLLAL